MKKLFVLFLLILLAVCSTGCKLKHPAVDALILRGATVAVFKAKPEYIAPAYAATEAALNLLEGEKPVALAEVERRVLEQLALDDFSEGTRKDIRGLISDLRSEIRARLISKGVEDPEQARVIAAAVIRIVNEVAAARLERTAEAGRK